jgi:hypothetical protein
MSFHARDVANMSEADRAAFLASLTPDEAEDLQYDWEHWARPEQRLPDGDWINWLIPAGRGMGKTRVGAETVRQWVKRYRYVNLIGATADDVRTISRKPRHRRAAYVFFRSQYAAKLFSSSSQLLPKVGPPGAAEEQ